MLSNEIQNAEREVIAAAEAWDKELDLLSYQYRLKKLREAIDKLREARTQAAAPRPQRYYVYSQRDAYKGHNNGCILWWRKGGHGYTNRLDDAGIFTDEDRSSGYPPEWNCHYVPVELVQSVAKTTTHAWHDDVLSAMKATAVEVTNA